MPILADLDHPAWDQLCALTTSWLLNASSPAEERALWRIKLKTRRIYEIAVHPEDAAGRMLRVLSQQVAMSKAA